MLLIGCTQTAQETGTKYVCADGKTIVADIKLCPAVSATQPTIELTLEEELSVCSKMPSVQGGSLEDFCIIGIAAKHKDTSICEEVVRDQRLTCYTIVAETKSDPDTCKEAESQADQCYSQYATDKKDGEICGKITDVSFKDSCYNNLAGQLSDATLCEQIKNISTKDSCYFNMAMRLADTSYCSKITSESQKQNCLQNIQPKTSQPIPIK